MATGFAMHVYMLLILFDYIQNKWGKIVKNSSKKSLRYIWLIIVIMYSSWKKYHKTHEITYRVTLRATFFQNSTFGKLLTYKVKFGTVVELKDIFWSNLGSNYFSSL